MIKHLFAFLVLVGNFFEASCFTISTRTASNSYFFTTICDLIIELLTKFVRNEHLCEGDNNQSLKDVSELVFLDVSSKT